MKRSRIQVCHEEVKDSGTRHKKANRCWVYVMKRLIFSSVMKRLMVQFTVMKRLMILDSVMKG